MGLNRISPRSIWLEACSVCQLKCRACPTHSGPVRPAIGSGFLKFSDFQELVRKNPRVKSIELSNYGEIFLNPELLDIIRFAHERGVALAASNGANFNRVSDEVLEGLVKYGFRSINCSIDGASDESYALYRVNGNYSKVIENIGKLNDYKRRYSSELPLLNWQFVVFGHNEHEVSRAKEMARSLGMTFRLKLSWDPKFAPVTDLEQLRAEIGAADREEFRQRFGVDYAHRCCYMLWTAPQINWDGRVLGCSRNFWADYGANAFTDGLTAAVNSPTMHYARQMLLGKKPADDRIACATCNIYEDMRARGAWITKSQIRDEERRSRRARWSKKVRKTFAFRVARFIYRSFVPVSGFLSGLPSGVHPLQLPLRAEGPRGFASQDIFRGSTKRLRLLTCHASVLTKDTIPHPIHMHNEEEVLIVLAGELDVIASEAPSPDGKRRIHLRPGQFVYYPLRFEHTVQTTSDEPANYLMFKWSAGAGPVRSPLGFGQFTAFDPATTADIKPGFSSRMFFSSPTNLLRKLSCHTSTLTPGAGYDPHVDPYDVGIVVLEGEVETLGKRVGPYGVIFYAEGEPHGMRNPGDTVTKYIVFEFHGRRWSLLPRPGI